MGDVELTPDEIGRRVKEKYRRIGEFPVMIRADFACPHSAVARVMNAVTANGIWKISFVAISEDKTSKPKGSYSSRPRLKLVRQRGG